MFYKHRKSLFEQHLTPNFHKNTTFNLSKHAHINATQWKQSLNKSDANIKHLIIRRRQMKIKIQLDDFLL